MEDRLFLANAPILSQGVSGQYQYSDGYGNDHGNGQFPSHCPATMQIERLQSHTSMGIAGALANADTVASHQITIP